VIFISQVYYLPINPAKSTLVKFQTNKAKPKNMRIFAPEFLKINNNE